MKGDKVVKRGPPVPPLEKPCSIPFSKACLQAKPHVMVNISAISWYYILLLDEIFQTFAELEMSTIFILPNNCIFEGNRIF